MGFMSADRLQQPCIFMILASDLRTIPKRRPAVSLQYSIFPLLTVRHALSSLWIARQTWIDPKDPAST